METNLYDLKYHGLYDDVGRYQELENKIKTLKKDIVKDLGYIILSIILICVNVFTILNTENIIIVIAGLFLIFITLFVLILKSVDDIVLSKNDIKRISEEKDKIMFKTMDNFCEYTKEVI